MIDDIEFWAALVGLVAVVILAIRAAVSSSGDPRTAAEMVDGETVTAADDRQQRP